MAQLTRGNDWIEALRLLQHLNGKLVRQVKFANNNFDIDAKIVLVAQDLDHPAARTLGRRWPVGDLHLDHHAFQVAPLVPAGLLTENTIPLGMLLSRPPRRSAACN